MGPFASFLKSIARTTAGDLVSKAGTAFNAISPVKTPDFGLSEAIAGKKPGTTNYTVIGSYKGQKQDGSTPTQDPAAGGGSYYGGGSYDPNTDPSALLSGRQTLRDKIAALNNLYGSIYGDLQNLTNTKRNELENSYAGQYKAADQGYQTGLGQIQNVMSSRGITDSSYNAEAQGTAKDAYTQDISNLDRAKQSDLAKVAQYYNSAYGGLQGGQQQLAAINPDQYGTVSDINSAVSQLDQQAQSLGQQRTNLMTDSQLAQQLQGIAPAKSITSDELTKQLQTLVTSSAPRFAKEQIAQGLIKRAQLQDPNAEAFWSDYFQKLLVGA